MAFTFDDLSSLMMAEVTTEKKELHGGHSRRFSTGNLDIQSHVSKIQPHYLTVSRGSCHDLCKFGFHNNLPDTKARRPSPKRYTAVPDKSRDLRRSVIDPVQRKQNFPVTFTHSLTTISEQQPNELEVTKKDDPESSKKVTSSLRRQISSPAELKDASPKYSNAPKPKTSSPSSTRQLNRRHSEIIIPKSLGTLKMSSSGKSKRNSQINTGEKLGASAKHSVHTKPKPFQKKASLVSSPRQFSRGQNEIIAPKGSGIRQISSFGGTAKHAIDSKQKPLQAKSSSPSTPRLLRRRHSEIFIPKELESPRMNSVGGSSGPRKSETKISKDSGTAKMAKKTSLVPERVSPSRELSPKRIWRTRSDFNKNLKKLPSTPKIQESARQAEGEHSNDENISEKTLYVIEPQSEYQGLVEIGSLTPHFSSSVSIFSEEKGTKNGENDVQVCQSPPVESSFFIDSQAPSLTSQSSASFSSEMNGEGSASETSESETENQVEDLEVEHKTRTRRIGRVGSEDSDQKLKFKSGKTVDVQPDNGSPMKLTFRHKKVLSEDESVKSGTRSLRRLTSDGALYDIKTEPVQVLLRHQDVEGRKDPQSLLNNVIEETASKLAKSRKSKVKALVGAFESVFSPRATKSSEITST